MRFCVYNGNSTLKLLTIQVRTANLRWDPTPGAHVCVRVPVRACVRVCVYARASLTFSGADQEVDDGHVTSCTGVM